MSDRELLELAAKAYGVTGQYVTNYASGDYYYQGNGEGILWEYPDGGYTVWNPFLDDGDALRLAVKLDMQITINRVDGWTEAIGGYMGEHRMRLPHESDIYAATRRAIIIVASKIGRNMP